MTRPRAATLSQLEVIAPRVDDENRAPRWPLVVLGGALLVDVLLAFTGFSALGIPDTIFFIVALVGWFTVARFFEERLFNSLQRLHYPSRMLYTGLWIVMAPLLALIVGSGIVYLLFQIGVDSAQPVQLFFAALWFSAACAGSMVVITMDRFISLFDPLLKHRVMFVVLGLGAIALLTAFFSTFLVQLTVQALDWAQTTRIEPFQQVLDSETMLRANEFLAGNMLRISFGSHVVSFLLALPAAISAVDKLANGVVERLEPLGRAFDRVAQGDRKVEVEVGGARDIQELIVHFNEMVGSLRLAERMERAFGTYVSQSVLEEIKSQHGEASIAPREVVASVLFADIRGFTAMSEKLSADAVLSLLNRYYSQVTRIIEEHQGYLDKFIGDAVVVVWNAPVDQPDHAARAIRCAIEIQRAIDKLNAQGAFPEIGTLEVGVGIATGSMVAGNVGDARRQMEYTVIGDTVNVSARLCGAAPAREVWVNKGCVDAARETVTALPAEQLPPLKLKGKSGALEAYRIWPRAEQPASPRAAHRPATPARAVAKPE